MSATSIRLHVDSGPALHHAQRLADDMAERPELVAIDVEQITADRMGTDGRPYIVLSLDLAGARYWTETPTAPKPDGWLRLEREQ